MSTISIITPFGKAHEKYLMEAYASLVAQTLTAFEWILVPNGGATLPALIAQDSRVKTFPLDMAVPPGAAHLPVGLLKRTACEKASGEIVVELDADDILLPTALEKIAARFQDPDIAFAYSNDAYFTDGTWEPYRFGAWFGWKDRPFNYKGHELVENLNFRPTVHALRHIFWAPDHVRAWRAPAYWAIGGHDAGLVSGDDHDLMCRFYIAHGERGFGPIDECLYLYRQHSENTCVKHNGGVQAQTDANYVRHNRAMVKRWAEDEGLRLIDLGGRFNKWEGYEAVDSTEPADIVADLNGPWPFEDGTVGVIKAYHVLEHLADPVHVMNEAFRVLAPGGWLLAEVPSTDGRGAFQDPTHRTFWNENSFWYYTDERYARFIRPAFNGRFQVSRMTTWYPDDFCRDHKILFTQADMIALKEPYASERAGEILI